MNEKPAFEKNTGEVEISDFLRLLGRIFTRIWTGIARLFTNLFELVLLFFLFLKRKAIWLGPAFLLGLGYGLYTYYDEGTVYRSELVAKSNFESNYFLYNQLDYFNSLISNRNFAEISRIFNLNESEAKNLVGFKAEPVKNDIEAAKLYRQTFLQPKRNHNHGFDTIWSRTMRFDAFKRQLTDKDFPVNRIIVRSKQPIIFPKIQQGILNSFNNNAELKEKKETWLQIRKQEEILLADALNNIDSLRKVYNKKLTMQSESTPGGSNQLILGEGDIRNPELDLYDKSMMIKDELIELKMKIAEEKDPLVLYAGLGSAGQAESPRRKVGLPALYLLAAAFSILVIIEFIKYLSRVEKRKKGE
jgi:hypothetical protein